MRFASFFLALVYAGGALAFMGEMGNGTGMAKRPLILVGSTALWPCVVSYLAITDFMTDYKWRHH